MSDYVIKMLLCIVFAGILILQKSKSGVKYDAKYTQELEHHNFQFLQTYLPITGNIHTKDVRKSVIYITT